MIRYANITVNDRNPIKRKLQRLRLRHGLRVIKESTLEFQGGILDYGSGDATLCIEISNLWPNSQIFSYEPAFELREQALENIASSNNITVIESLSEVKSISFDYIFCLEVLEHLPPKEIQQVFEEIQNLATDKTIIVFGVPNEIFLSAFIKGIFRMTRRFGDVDASPGNIIRATLGIPPEQRPVGKISEGLPYIFRHMGFDYRKLKNLIETKFCIKKMYGSPSPILPNFLNFEIYYICQRRNN